MYLRYRKSPGNIRCKSAIVDLCVCEMKRTRYIGNKVQFIDISGKVSARVCPQTIRNQKSANCFEQRTKCPRCDVLYAVHSTYTCTYVYRVSHALTLASLCKSTVAIATDIDSSYVSRVTRNCRTYTHRIRARTWRIAYPTYIIHIYDVICPAHGGGILPLIRLR